MKIQNYYSYSGFLLGQTRCRVKRFMRPDNIPIFHLIKNIYYVRYSAFTYAFKNRLCYLATCQELLWS